MRRTFSIIAAFLLACTLPCKAQIIVPEPSLEPLRVSIDTAEVFIIGDVMMHSAQLSKDCHPFLQHIAPKSKKADISIANAEFSVAGKPYTGYPTFSTPEYYPEYLVSDYGADILLTANNHILDKGSKGLERTLETYRHLQDSLGVQFTGSALSPEEYEQVYPLIVRANGIRVALINFTYGTNLGGSTEWPKVQRMDKEAIAAAFQRAKEHHADFIIALPHWGEEYSLKHNKKQQEWAEWLVAQGADAIVGAHPHVVQDSTTVNGVPVFYSIGNAVSNMSAINTRLELSVTLRFVLNRVSGEKQMLQPEVNFMWCTLPGTLTDNYSTIFIKEWANRKNDWLTPYDYENMLQTYQRVKTATGISD